MTPLAQRIVKELTLPARQRTFLDGARIMNVLPAARCFEITDILKAVTHLLTPQPVRDQDASAAVRDRVADVARQTSFLPAPCTWIEWGNGSQRVGCLLVEIEDQALVAVATADPAREVFCSLDYTFEIGLAARGGRSDQYRASRDLTASEERDVADATATLNGALAFINAPNIIERKEHAPHRGLERKLKGRLDTGADLCLLPWAEIKLAVTPPEDAGSDGAAGERLTGSRALHFCRSHLRLRNGRLEMVRAHWRGDPAAGVKQSNYRVVP